LKGRGTKYETKKFKVTKYDTSSGFEAGESQRNELNDIAKMYRKALRINGITYEDGGMMDDMQMAKSSARANIDYDDMVKDAMEYAGSEWLNMTKSQKDELISEMYHQRKQHISSFARGGMVNLDDYKNIDELIELYKVNSKWYAYGKRYNHETTGSGYTKKEALEDLDTHLSYVSPRDEYNDGGEIEEEEEYDYENDLFNNVESLPQDVQSVLEKYQEDWEDTYENCANMQDELEELGYTFDYYLDATPYNLRKMEDGGMMAKGGKISVDLFEYYQQQPPKLKKIVNKWASKYDEDEVTYKQTQKFLKEVQAVGKLNTTLSSHVGRHIFASTVALQFGLPMETLAKVLGHTNLRTTMIYGKILDNKIKNDFATLRENLR
jgi:hypothetical protein